MTGSPSPLELNASPVPGSTFPIFYFSPLVTPVPGVRLLCVFCRPRTHSKQILSRSRQRDTAGVVQSVSIWLNSSPPTMAMPSGRRSRDPAPWPPASGRDPKRTSKVVILSASRPFRLKNVKDELSTIPIDVQETAICASASRDPCSSTPVIISIVRGMV